MRSDAASPIAPPATLARVAGHVLGALVDPFVLGSFDRIGYRIHALRFDPRDLDVDCTGRRCLVTGANSGIGWETARALADLGAEVVLLCRSRERGEAAADAIRKETGNPRVAVEALDVSDLAAVREVGARLAAAPVDVLVHNAGGMPHERIETRDGLELDFATHVAGPHLLTKCLRARLEASPDARVVWVSSGGMYSYRLDLADVAWKKRPYDGVAAYAQTKRMQVVLAELWAARLAGTSVTVSAMHPGWADTPAVATALPRFHRLTQAVLRTPAEGADTVVWLAASPAARTTGRFWFDRAPRRTHWLPFTRESDADRRALWRLCERVTGAPRPSRRSAPSP
jgi:NAD(P)-dependent dehydrogenase (short-subunit alcohol dehydrogenase family)